MERVEGVYKDDLDICVLHDTMLKEFKSSKSKLTNIRNRIKELKDELEKPMYMIEKKKRIKELDSLTVEEFNIANNIKRDEYIDRVTDIVNEYSQLPRLKKHVVFTSTGANIVHDETYERRQMLINIYLSILRNYTQVDVTKHLPHNDVIRYNIQISGSGKDSNQDMPSKNNYETRENFRKVMLRYQCKEDVVFPEDLESKLDDHFTKYSMLTGAKVRELNVNGEWHFLFTNKELLFRALADIKYNNYYKYWYSIVHFYWGWHVRDISNIEEEIMEEYDMAQRVYEKIKSKFKKKISSMNAQYSLLRLLKRKKHECEVRDFKIIKTPDILDSYEEIWRITCDELGWEFEYIF